MRLIQRALIGLAAGFFLFAVVPARSEAQSLGNLGSIGNLGSLSGLLNLLTSLAPPAMPNYYQPPAPAQNQIWQPGYWASGPAGYFWVPGTWVTPPQQGLLWTPGYWAANQGGQYRWNPGYWAQNVGYYGGINYGNGYNGAGYSGGRWQNNTFYYNTAITNVNRTAIHYVYSDRGANTYNGSHVSYNGGRGGVRTRPDQHQIAWARERHYAMTSAQQEHVRVAAQDRNYLQAVNHGHPLNVSVQRPLGATNRPAGFAQIRASDRAAAARVNHAPISRPPSRNVIPHQQAQRKQPHQQAQRQQPHQQAQRQQPHQQAQRQQPHQAQPHGHPSPHPVAM
ncbi:MAG: YXWGXW repeat-containing protein [Vulcanimicrobiaceae bacterium]